MPLDPPISLRSSEDDGVLGIAAPTLLIPAKAGIQIVKRSACPPSHAPSAPSHRLALLFPTPNPAKTLQLPLIISPDHAPALGSLPNRSPAPDETD